MSPGAVFDDPVEPGQGPFAGLADWYRKCDLPEAYAARRDINTRYAAFPDRNGMVLSRLRGADDLGVEQATDELYVHSLMPGSYEVRYEEDSTSPDFRLYRSTEYIASIEILTLFPEETFSTELARNNALVEEIKRRVSPAGWYVSIKVIKWHRQPRVADVARWLDRTMADLPAPHPSLTRAHRRPERYVSPEVELEFAFLPRTIASKAETLGVLGPAIWGYVQPARRLRRNLSKKVGGKYDHRDRPFAVVVVARDHSCDAEDILNALYGDEVYSYIPDVPGSARHARKNNGTFGRSPSRPQGRVRRLSCVFALVHGGRPDRVTCRRFSALTTRSPRLNSPTMCSSPSRDLPQCGTIHASEWSGGRLSPGDRTASLSGPRPRPQHVEPRTASTPAGAAIDQHDLVVVHPSQNYTSARPYTACTSCAAAVPGRGFRAASIPLSGGDACRSLDDRCRCLPLPSSASTTPEKDGSMSASARDERAEQNRRNLPHEHSYVPRADYYRRWQVDPERATADHRELGWIEDHIVRTAVYRLIAPRQATVAGQRDRLPDPRLVNPEVRARTTRDAMDILTRLLTTFACQARGAGWSWGELARSVAVHHRYPNWTISGSEAFESLTGQAPGAAGMRTLTWCCGSCNQQITDRGPYGHPGDCESGHAADCARHNHEVATYERWARPAIDPTLLRTDPQAEEDNSTENLCRTIRSSRCGCARCFYCDRPLTSRRHEHDHFPVPRSARGNRVVPACLDCHELKDQYHLRSWPHAELAAAWHAILTCLEYEGYPDGEDLAYVRMIDWWQDQPDSSDQAVIARWPRPPAPQPRAVREGACRQGTPQARPSRGHHYMHRIAHGLSDRAVTNLRPRTGSSDGHELHRSRPGEVDRGGRHAH